MQKKGLSRKEASYVVRDFAKWPVIENSLDPLFAALTEQTRWNISLWDSLIIAAARAAGATELWSEDFSDGQDMRGFAS